MKSERAAEAIALHPCTLAAVGLLLLVEEGDERGGVPVDGSIGQRRLKRRAAAGPAWDR